MWIAALVATVAAFVFVAPPPRLLWVRVPPSGALLIDVRYEPGGEPLTDFVILPDPDERDLPKPAPRAIVLERVRGPITSVLHQLGILTDVVYTRPTPPATVR